jgi:hypothetical protein
LVSYLKETCNFNNANAFLTTILWFFVIFLVLITWSVYWCYRLIKYSINKNAGFTSPSPAKIAERADFKFLKVKELSRIRKMIVVLFGLTEAESGHLFKLFSELERI